jgi:hypothetical protein
MLHYNFNNIQDLVNSMHNEVETGKGTKLQYNYFLNGYTNDRAAWCGGIGLLNEYINTLKTGFEPAVNELKNTSLNIEGLTQSLIPSICGQFGDVSKYLNNEPECMFEFDEITTNKYLTVHISGVTPYTMDAGQLMDRCKVIFNCINNLELNGTRVKIYLSIATNETKSTTAKNQVKKQIKVLIKDFNENFVPGYHGLLIGHLSTIRGLFYAYMSIHNKKNSLGACIDSEIEPGEIYIAIRKDSENTIVKKLS